MLGRLLLLFTVVPITELLLLIWVGDRIGFWPTFALVLLTGVLGASLARLQGIATWRRFRKATEERRLPSTEIAEGVLLLIAGAVLLTPGILTDLLGFTLLVPPIRRGLARQAVPLFGAWLLGRRGARRTAGPRHSPDPRGQDVIDAEFEVLDPPGSESTR